MNANNGLNNITEMYRKLNYFDQYGGSVILFILITYIIVSLIAFCYIKINSQPVVDNWPNYRCKPYIIPFAGFITKPEGVSAWDYTSQNFNYCTQSVLKSGMGNLLNPITFVTNLIKNIMDGIASAINDIRGMFNKIRTALQEISQEIMGRIMNIIIPLQQIIMGFKDIIAKTQGVMTSSLYTFLGSYLTMKSLMGTIAKMIVSILIILASVIAVFWLLPFSWPWAVTNTAIFVALSIPMAIILNFMNKTMQINTGLTIPKLKCFDENTLLVMNDGSKKRIVDVVNGDILLDNNIVTATIQVESKGSQMYSLDGILFSDTHIVKHNNLWIPVSKHPHAIKYAFYDKSYLYCLNTSKKVIVVKSHTFTDWDEVYSNELIKLKQNKLKPFTHNKDIHTYLDGGFIGNTQIQLKNGSFLEIKDLKIGTVLKNGETIYGVVKIDGKNVEDHNKYILNDLSDNCIIGGPNLVYSDKNMEQKLTLNLEIDKKIKIHQKEEYLYHLLTDKKNFYIKNIQFFDYNAGIDVFLEK
jgi:hypothetical protein